MRFVAQKSREVYLKWHPRSKAFEFRLLYGEDAVTPPLKMTPHDWYGLIQSNGLELWDRKTDTPKLWVVLQLKAYRLIVHVRYPLRFDTPGGTSPDCKDWPSMYWQEFYNTAAQERGVRPEEGWQESYEAYLDAKRERWGGA